MARATCVEPSEHRILSTIVALLICVPAVTAAVPEQARAGGDPGRKCAATKMSAVGQDLAALMHCVTTAVRQGKPLDPECAQGAAARLEGRFVKAEEKGGCFAMAEGSLLAHRASELVAVIANGVPSAPPCSELGMQCGSCGTGFCVAKQPYDPLDPQLFCAKPLNPFSRHCDSDSQCGIGESCGFLGDPALNRFCYAHCPGCEDGIHAPATYSNRRPAATIRSSLVCAVTATTATAQRHAAMAPASQGRRRTATTPTPAPPTPVTHSPVASTSPFPMARRAGRASVAAAACAVELSEDAVHRPSRSAGSRSPPRPRARRSGYGRSSSVSRPRTSRVAPKPGYSCGAYRAAEGR